MDGAAGAQAFGELEQDLAVEVWKFNATPEKIRQIKATEILGSVLPGTTTY